MVLRPSSVFVVAPISAPICTLHWPTWAATRPSRKAMASVRRRHPLGSLCCSLRATSSLRLVAKYDSVAAARPFRDARTRFRSTAASSAASQRSLRSSLLLFSSLLFSSLLSYLSSLPLPSSPRAKWLLPF